MKSTSIATVLEVRLRHEQGRLARVAVARCAVETGVANTARP